jgi:hypothetical protein
MDLGLFLESASAISAGLKAREAVFIEHQESDYMRECLDAYDGQPLVNIGNAQFESDAEPQNSQALGQARRIVRRPAVTVFRKDGTGNLILDAEGYPLMKCSKEGPTSPWYSLKMFPPVTPGQRQVVTCISCRNKYQYKKR